MRTLSILLIAAAVIAVSPFSADAQTGRIRAAPLGPAVVWPTTGGVVRDGANGLVLDDGVANVEESDQYSLVNIAVDEAGEVVRFSYVDVWSLDQTWPSTCDFTYRRVPRELTQKDANTLASTLAPLELDRLKQGYADLLKVGETEKNGAVVTQYLDRFTFGSGDTAGFGQTKTWLFIRGGKAYYVNKTCIAHADAASVTVIDQLIGLDYRRDPAPTT